MFLALDNALQHQHDQQHEAVDLPSPNYWITLGMFGEHMLNLYDCQVDKMSPAKGGALRLGSGALDPPNITYGKALGMSGGAILNLY